jgi:hypothetical protein
MYNLFNLIIVPFCLMFFMRNNEGKGVYRVGPGISKVVHEPLPHVLVWAFAPLFFAAPLPML